MCGGKNHLRSMSAVQNSQLIVNRYPDQRDMHDGKATNLFQLVLSCQHSKGTLSAKTVRKKIVRETPNRESPMKVNSWLFILLSVVRSKSRSQHGFQILIILRKFQETIFMWWCYRWFSLGKLSASTSWVKLDWEVFWEKSGVTTKLPASFPDFSHLTLGHGVKQRIRDY